MTEKNYPVLGGYMLFRGAIYECLGGFYNLKGVICCLGGCLCCSVIIKSKNGVRKGPYEIKLYHNI